MYGYSRKSVTVMIEGLPGALEVKDYIFHAHRHSGGRKRETTKKPKTAKKTESTSTWVKIGLKNICARATCCERGVEPFDQKRQLSHLTTDSPPCRGAQESQKPGSGDPPASECAAE